MAQIFYLRCSTDEQAESGLGLEAQRAAIVKAVGEPDATFSDEGLSGSNPRRPGLLGALEALHAGDTLIVARRDRLARDTYLALWIEKEAKRRGAAIISAAGEGNGDDPAAQLMRTLVDAFATYERQMIGARTAAAFAVKRQKGEKCGGAHVPFGYRLNADGQTLAEDPNEQRVLSLIQRLREEGESLRAIGAHLKAKGYTSRKGTTAWHPQTLKQIIDRQAYKVAS